VCFGDAQETSHRSIHDVGAFSQVGRQCAWLGLQTWAVTRHHLIATSDPLPPMHRGKTVAKLFALDLLGLALSKKQIPQIVETIRNVEN